MTSPFVLTSDPWSDYAHSREAFQRELAAMQAGQSQRFGSYVEQTGMPQQQNPVAAQAGAPATAAWHDEDLVAAATYWDIPEDVARAMPRDQLVAVVNQKREQARAGGNSMMAEAFAPVAMFGVGAGEAVTGLMRHIPTGLRMMVDPVYLAQQIPGVRNYFQGQDAAHDADMAMRRLEEGLRASTPESEQFGLSAANVGGNLAAMWVPAGTLFRFGEAFAGGLPLIGKSAIARAAFAGGASAYVMSANSPEFKDHPAETLAFGATLGAGFKALEPALTQVIGRVTRRFIPPDVPQGPWPSESQQGPFPSGPSQLGPDGGAGDMEIPVTDTRGFPQQAEAALWEQARAGDDQAAEMVRFLQAQRSARNTLVQPDVSDMEIPMQGLSPLGGPSPSPEVLSPPGAVAVGGRGGAVSPRSMDDLRNTAVAAAVRLPGGTIYASETGGHVALVQKLIADGTVPRNVASALLTPDTFGFADAQGNFIPQGRNQSTEWILGYDVVQKPSQPYNAVDRAAALAGQMNKVGAIAESPLLPEITSQTDITESSVVDAMEATNPGGTNIVQGVSDPATLLQRGNVQFARRGGRLDALVNKQPLSEQQIAQYEQHGVYQGQTVLDANGNQTVVNLLFPHPTMPQIGMMAEVKAPFSIHAERVVPVSDLTPLRSSPETMDVPDLWHNFQQYATARAVQENAVIGASVNPEQVFATRQYQLKNYLGDFLDASGIQSPGDRARVSAFMNDRFVESFESVDPAGFAGLRAATKRANAPVVHQPTELEALDQAAAVKGFVAVPDGATGGITLVDAAQPSGASIPQPDIESAATFVRSFNRELPDFTPRSDVPIELAGGLPQEATQASADLTHDADLIDAIREMEHSDMGGGAGGGGGPPAAGPPSGGEPPDTPGPRTAEARDDIFKGRVMKASLAFEQGLNTFRVMSKLMSNMSSFLRENYQHDFGLLRNYTDMLQAHDMNVTWKSPWIREMDDVLSTIRRSTRDSGQWMRFWQMNDENARNAAAQAAGFQPEEIAAFSRADAVLDRMYEQPGASRDMADYVSHIAGRQSVESTRAEAWDGFSHTPFTQNLQTVYGEGNLNLRDASPDRVFAHLIGSEGWMRFVNDAYQVQSKKWMQLGQAFPEIGPIADIFGNWTNAVRYGYSPTQSRALMFGHAVLQGLMGPEVTEQQARQLFGGGLSLTQQALLGFKPHVIVRDGLRLAYAIPKIGQDMLDTIGAFMKGGTEVQDRMWQFAVDRGIVTQQSSSIHPPGYFEGPPTGDEENVLSGEGGSLRHQIMQKIYYGVSDNMPAWMRKNTPGKFSPLYWVGKQAEMMRMLVGNAQYAKTIRALGQYRAAGELANPSELLGNTGLNTIDKPYQNVFLQHVASGNDEAAATFAARTMVDQTMFRYGHLESPIFAQSFSGRIALQLGNYGLHTFEYLNSAARNGTVSDKVKAFVGLGGLSVALGAAQKKTGWKFLRMAPTHGLAFTGGPWLEPAVDALSNLGGTFQYAQGTDTPTNRAAFDATTSPSRVLGAGLGMLNPFGGLVRDAEAVGTALQSPSPAMAMLRFATTGEINNQPDINAWLAPQAEAAFQQRLQHMQSPVRSDAWGTAQVPPQMPAYDSQMQSPQQQYDDFVRSLPQQPDQPFQP